MFKRQVLETHEGSFNETLYCAKVPGGWFIRFSQYGGESMTFYPDPEHEWDDTTLE